MRGGVPDTSSRGTLLRDGTHRVTIIVGADGIKGVWLVGTDNHVMQIDGAAARQLAEMLAPYAHGGLLEQYHSSQTQKIRRDRAPVRSAVREGNQKREGYRESTR